MNNPYAKNYGSVSADTDCHPDSKMNLSRRHVMTFHELESNIFFFYFCSSFFSPDSLGSSGFEACSAPEASRSLCIFL